MRERRGRRLAVVAFAASAAALVLFGGCGEDDVGGGGGGTLDVNGFWKSHFALGGNPEEAMGLTCFEQTGDSVLAVGGDMVISGTVSGSTLTWRADITGGDYITATCTPSGADELSGPFGLYDSGDVLQMSGTVRFVRYAPSGAFSASGTVDKGAGTVSINVSTATDGWGDIDGVGGVAGRVNVYYSSPSFGLKFNFGGEENITTGPLTVLNTGGSPGPGEVDLEIFVTDLAGAIYYVPDSGSFNISKYDATGFAGTFTLGFETVPDTLTGSFDVPWDIYKGTPF